MTTVDGDSTAASVATEEAAEPASDDRASAAPRRWTGLLWDLGALTGFVAAALYLTQRLWRDGTGVSSTNRPDHAFFEWMLAHGARVVTHLENPLFTTRMNAPVGVNMMANTSILGLSIPLSPVTLLFGAGASLAVLLVLVYAATGLSWYYVLSRHVVTSRVAALLGGAFCAFAPGMVSHGNGHPNIVAQFLVPFIVWRTLRLRERGWLNVVRNGVVLGLLITWQAFINEEVLLFTAMGVGLFTIVAGLSRREWRRQALPFLAGLGVAALVAGALLAYPLWVQFTGPGAYHGFKKEFTANYSTNLAAYPAFSRLSLGGSDESVRGLTQNPTEENAFLGWPLLILLGLLVLALCRSLVAMAVALVGAVFAAGSLGPVIRWRTDEVGTGPWHWLHTLPLFESVIPSRLALAAVPAVGLLLALAWDRWRRWTPALPRWLRYPSFVVWPAVVVAALLPLVPRPLPVLPKTPAPALLSSGALEEYTAEDRSVVFVPLPRNGFPDAIYWSAEAGLPFRMVRGYFLGPASYSDDPKRQYAVFTAPPRPTSVTLEWVYRNGRVPRITPKHRQEAVEDLRYWRASVVVLAPGRSGLPLMLAVSRMLNQQPRWVDGAWVWDVRHLTAG